MLKQELEDWWQKNQELVAEMRALLQKDALLQEKEMLAQSIFLLQGMTNS